LFSQGSLIDTDSSFSSSAKSTQEVFISGANKNGTAGNFTNLICAFHSFGYGITSSQASIFYNAVQALQTALGRQV
jgi:hypothetical protein